LGIQVPLFPILHSLTIKVESSYGSFTSPIRLSELIIWLSSFPVKPLYAGLELPDAGLELPDAGLKLPDAGLELPDAGLEIPDAGLELPDAGLEIPDAGLELPDAGRNVSTAQIAGSVAVIGSARIGLRSCLAAAEQDIPGAKAVYEELKTASPEAAGTETLCARTLHYQALH
jgi:hypothetical protein